MSNPILVLLPNSGRQPMQKSGPCGARLLRNPRRTLENYEGDHVLIHWTGNGTYAERLATVTGETIPRPGEECGCRARSASFLRLCTWQGKNAEVLASFYPHQPEDWRGGTVTFYPFLIVTKREGRDKAVWLPYWHVTQDGEKENLKYGQWAPFMDMEFFEDLLSQARSAGYLNDEA